MPKFRIRTSSQDTLELARHSEVSYSKIIINIHFKYKLHIHMIVSIVEAGVDRKAAV